MSAGISAVAVEGLGEVTPGDDIGALVAETAKIEDGDVVVISQKVISKAEGRIERLDQVSPGAEAVELAAETERDPALVELILRESRRLIRATAAALIVETHSGLVCANAGIDSSNAGPDTGSAEAVLLLPTDPDASARRIRAALKRASGAQVAVVIADSFGRPWRLGQTDVAIGCAGLAPLDDWRGRNDRDGRELAATEIAVADQVAAAADLVRNKSAGLPVVVVRGLIAHVTEGDGPGAAAIQRPADQDLFR